MKHITLQLIKEYLERFGWKNYEAVNEPFEQEGIIYTGWRSSENSPVYMVCIDPMIEKKCLSFRTQNLIRAPFDKIPKEQILNLLLALEWINYRIIIGKFAYEPVYGDIRFSIDLPIDENTISYEQFVHSLGLVVEVVETYAPIIVMILEGKVTAERFIQNDLRGEVLLEKTMMSKILKDLLSGLGRVNLN
ncbi:MAG TPA: YbjN domain-containing protein [Candidatus Hydrogenedens sp.]|nr:YbjN domain-containing protein [Candidatus Hydrogenedens sp.]HOK10356.1 YbjN domain-containing protein [Candidatus Hydrogenedens sp.]HOL20681.1 YbjN domain-containing protein [Candidatus Hydrogenedens sp.]HPP59855.1 YbjN domain-containing protein [Candidatus Hydrogenedens sp.]